MNANPIPVPPVCPKGIFIKDYEKMIYIHSLIMKDLSKPMPTISKLAALVHMSPTKFRSLFVKIFNASIYQYHLQARLDLAKHLLLTNEFTITQIAYKVGFDRSQSFAKSFLIHTGFTAGQFRDLYSL
ncbi:MAG: AraC family transcriptional regulator [Spirosomataceae bacterium]